MRIASLSLLALCLTLAAVPVMAQSYNNGPVNGLVDAWAISSGFAVSDTFEMNSAGSINSLNFWAWVAPGDSVTGVQVGISASPFGSELYTGTFTVTQGACQGAAFGFDVCNEAVNGLGSGNIAAGNYWLTLQNATDAFGEEVFWDENSGVGCTSPGCPSMAQQSTLGTVPSESFTIDWGASTTTTTTSTTGGSTPEPSSIMLFGSGILGLAGILRRKLF
jgi:hypothetical protein